MRIKLLEVRNSFGWGYFWNKPRKKQFLPNHPNYIILDGLNY